MPQISCIGVLPRSAIALAVAVFLVAPALASGGYGRNVGQSRTDPLYELGKSIYHGRSKTARGLKICIATATQIDNQSEEETAAQIESLTAAQIENLTAAQIENETAAPTKDETAIPLSSRSLRPFKGKALTDLTTRLVDCTAPSSPVAKILDASEFQALVYYLNERFKLKLET